MQRFCFLPLWFSSNLVFLLPALSAFHIPSTSGPCLCAPCSANSSSWKSCGSRAATGVFSRRCGQRRISMQIWADRDDRWKRRCRCAAQAPLQLATRLEAPTYKSKAVSLVRFLADTKRVLRRRLYGLCSSSTHLSLDLFTSQGDSRTAEVVWEMWKKHWGPPVNVLIADQIRKPSSYFAVQHAAGRKHDETKDHSSSCLF